MRLATFTLDTVIENEYHGVQMTAYEYDNPEYVVHYVKNGCHIGYYTHDYVKAIVEFQKRVNRLTTLLKERHLLEVQS